MKLPLSAKECYDKGVAAKKRSYMRVPPFYEKPRQDYWWLAGFDGIAFETAETNQPEFAWQEMSANAARIQGIPVKQGVDVVRVES